MDRPLYLHAIVNEYPYYYALIWRTCHHEKQKQIQLFLFTKAYPYEYQYMAKQAQYQLDLISNSDSL